jgi:3D (Asp-Asp-Asp) domain-containing protein
MAFITTFVASLTILSLISCGSSSSHPDSQPNGPTTPVDEAPKQPAPPSSSLQSIGFLRPSFYWISLEPKNDDKKTQPLLDPDGNVLATVSDKYFKALKMEGTGRLLDGRVINFKSRITNPDGTKEIRWRICGAEAPYGFGYADVTLSAFRSVAVDPSVIPLGSKVYIPAARGIKLPDGTVHDGLFDAVDIGDLIQNKKIDIFTSFGDQSAVFEKSGLVTGTNVEIFIVK